MSNVIFPYGIRFQEDGKLDIFPVAEVSILGERSEGIRAMFLLDSGATTSILPIGDADALGIKINKNVQMVVRGFSGEEAIGYKHVVSIALNGTQLKIPVIFVDAAVPRVLGREGIFAKFSIIFDESARRTGFFNAPREKKMMNKLFT